MAKKTTIIDEYCAVVRAHGVNKTADGAGVPQSTVKRILSGEREPQLATIVQTLAATGHRLAIVPIESPENNSGK